MSIIGDDGRLPINKRLLMLLLLLLFFLSSLWLSRSLVNAPRPVLTGGDSVSVNASRINSSCILLSISAGTGGVHVYRVRVGEVVEEVNGDAAPGDGLRVMVCGVGNRSRLGIVEYSVNGRSGYRLFTVPGG